MPSIGNCDAEDGQINGKREWRMSLDIWLESPTCPTCGHSEGSGFNRNTTYNHERMWHAMYPDLPMVPIDGMTGEESLPLLTQVLSKLLADPEKFSALEPDNGWGSYAIFVVFIRDLIDDAEKKPKAVWKAWR
jgi:hypothetical protein